MSKKGLLQRDEDGGVRIQATRISRAEDKKFLNPNDEEGFAYSEQDGGLLRSIPSATRRGSLERIGNRELEFNPETGKYNVGPLAQITMALEGLTHKDLYKYKRSQLRKEQEDNLTKADDLIDLGYSVTPAGAKVTVNPDSNAVNYRDLKQGLTSAGELKTEVDTYKLNTGEDANRELGVDALKNINERNTALSTAGFTREDAGIAKDQVVSQGFLEKKIRELENNRSNFNAENSYDEVQRRKELNYDRNVAAAVRNRAADVQDRDFRLSTIQAENQFALSKESSF